MAPQGAGGHTPPEELARGREEEAPRGSSELTSYGEWGGGGTQHVLIGNSCAKGTTT